MHTNNYFSFKALNSCSVFTLLKPVCCSALPFSFGVVPWSARTWAKSLLVYALVLSQHWWWWRSVLQKHLSELKGLGCFKDNYARLKMFMFESGPWLAMITNPSDQPKTGCSHCDSFVLSYVRVQLNLIGCKNCNFTTPTRWFLVGWDYSRQNDTEKNGYYCSIGSKAMTSWK